MSNHPRVSVVIPCYNQGVYLGEAIESVTAQTLDNYEIIIVNDGSTEQETMAILERLAFPMTRVLHTSNQGLAAARNNGIREALGDYILPLDADDRICPAYLETAAAVLDERPEVGFVYCLARLFGARSGLFYLNEATLGEMLLDCRVFCSAMFRKADWEAAGGYNTNMCYGWEDWDFWLSILELGKTSFLIPEVLFHYRVKNISMIRSMTPEQKLTMQIQLFENHRELYCRHMGLVFEEYHRLKNSWYGKVAELIRKISFNLKYLGK
jgi:glycosyltransferase involved in cell wall biosynthesis